MSKNQNKLNKMFKSAYENVPLNDKCEIIPTPLVMKKIPDFVTKEEMDQLYSIKYDGMDREEFRLVEYENIIRNKYYISSYGRIFNTKGFRLIPFQTKSKHNNVWYYRIALQCENNINGKIYHTERKFDVHRLVATAFIPKTEEDILLNRNFVNHKLNMDGRCNFVWNLEWVNNSENILHAINNKDLSLSKNIYKNPMQYEDITTQCGENNGRSKFTNQQIETFCESYYYYGLNLFESMERSLIEYDEENKRAMDLILQGKTWRSISFKYIMNNYNNSNINFDPIPLVFFE